MLAEGKPIFFKDNINNNKMKINLTLDGLVEVRKKEPMERAFEWLNERTPTHNIISKCIIVEPTSRA